MTCNALLLLTTLALLMALLGAEEEEVPPVGLLVLACSATGLPALYHLALSDVAVIRLLLKDFEVGRLRRGKTHWVTRQLFE
jgi:hypothetical protein